MVRPTSKAAIDHLRDTGKIQKKLLEVHELLKRFGPGTAAEIEAAALAAGIKCPGAWKRLSDLKKIGLARETCRIKCRITGRLAVCITGEPEQRELFPGFEMANPDGPYRATATRGKK